jgi:NAD(P)-dependent dehydrogenase (short-subunit alcohol dehydrogenase family)
MTAPMSSRTALIIGADGGLASATIQTLASWGWTVYGAVRDGDVAAKVDALGAAAIVMDVTPPASVQCAAEELGANSPSRLQALANATGVIVLGPMELIPADELLRQFEIHPVGPASVTRNVADAAV